MEQGFRVTMTVKKPIQSLKDFEGMKIRLPEDKVLIRTFQLVKAAPTVIPWGEVYTSLQTGVVEGMEATTPGHVHDEVLRGGELHRARRTTSTRSWGS